MYELVNTSVPNGLIAGTHGFATVAMTKGMPDAIRTRVEGLCAYPHRTSAHDESYYRENPVNWFHLTLPSGDHVIGRTAPSDFDYTGRTNRLARTIVFRRGEMPVSGGCEAIRIAGSRLSEKWSGEPRMLPADKALAAKFFALERSRDATPANWVALFGDNGIFLAKRVAMLVARNAMGGGKSVYFKTSTSWDADGTKLLALFSDIINLLPDEAAPLVTFSTFAACVPSGVTCHLRGVYDKDKAFELASATQPWVDCEHGRVMHEELLPSESAPVGVSHNGSVGENVSTSQSVGSRIGVRRDSSSLSGQAVRARDARWQDFAPRGSGSDKAFYTLLGSLALLVVLVAIGCIWLVKRSSRTSTSDDDQLMAEINAVEAVEKERAEKENRDRAEQKKPEEESAAKEKARNETAEAAKKKKEADDKANAEKEAITTRRAAEAEEAEEKENARREDDRLKSQNLSLPLDKLKITKLLPTAKALKVGDSFEIPTADIGNQSKIDKLDHVLAKYMSILTNENSIVVYYCENNDIKMMPCKYNGKLRMRGVGNSSAKSTFTAVGWPGAASQSPWVVCRVVNPEWQKSDGGASLDAFWWWNDSIEPMALFADSDKADLKNYSFRCQEAYDAYSTYGKVVYKVSWVEGRTRWAFNTISPELEIESFKPDSVEIDGRLDALEGEKDRLGKDKKEKDDAVKKGKELKKDIEDWEDELIRKYNEKEGEKDQEKKKKLGKDFGARKNKINEVAVEELKKLGIQGRQLTGNETEKKNIVEEIDRKIKRLEADIKGLEEQIQTKGSEIGNVKNAANKWKDDIRKRKFVVTTVMEVGSYGDGKKYKDNNGAVIQ